MKRLILITFSDPTKTWCSSKYRDYVGYFLERFRERFGVKEEIEIVIRHISLPPNTQPSKVLGDYFRDRNSEVVGVVVQAHESLEINQKILFLAEIMREDNHPIEIIFFENGKTFLLKSVFRGKIEGEEL